MNSADDPFQNRKQAQHRLQYLSPFPVSKPIRRVGRVEWAALRMWITWPGDVSSTPHPSILRVRPRPSPSPFSRCRKPSRKQNPSPASNQDCFG